MCLCMVLSLLPTISLPASAAGTGEMMFGANGIAGYDSVNKLYNYIYFGSFGGKQIKWRVLTNTNGNGGTFKDINGNPEDSEDAMFLMSEDLLGETEFGTDTVWANSSLKKWMKDNLYDKIGVFSSLEKEHILKTTTTADKNDIYFNACQLSEDTLFALSGDEATRGQYGFGTWDISDSNRIGLYKGNAQMWYLRSAHAINQNFLSAVNSDGRYIGMDKEERSNIRPAFNLNRTKVQYLSAAVGGKVTGPEGADALTAVSATIPTEWKLTLLDSSGHPFSALATSISSNSVSIAYSGAKTGPNEYISAAIVGTSNNVLFYGRIKNANAANGSAKINIPSGITLGINATLYAFNEQCNGDYKTDYSSVAYYFPSVIGYAVDYSLANVTTYGNYYISNNNTSDYWAMLSPDSGYMLPESISVTIGGVAATLANSEDEADTAGEYYYNKTTGQIKVAKVNGPVVITAAGVAKTYTISASPTTLDFGTLTEGYTESPDMQTFDITNTGNSNVTLKSIIGGANYTYSYEPNKQIKPGEKYSIGIWPTYDLAVGPHTETLTIETNEGSPATVSLNFTVTAKPAPVEDDPPVYRTITASAGVGGSISPSGSSSIEQGYSRTYSITTDKGFKISDVLVDGVSVGAVSSYTFDSVYSDHTITASFKEIEVPNPFSDINKNDWFYDSVMFVLKKGIMTGSSPNTFSPDDTTTRSMLVTVLYRLSGDTGSHSSTFSDVVSGSWYEKAVAWAAESGITSGVGGGKFAPEDNLSREQLAVMLYNYAKSKGYDISAGGNTQMTYNDAAGISDYAYTALRWACGMGIIKGDGGNLNPKSFASRAEVAAMLERLIRFLTA